MPAARGVKRSASKTSTTTTGSTGSRNKKKQGIQLEIPVAPKQKGRVLTCGQGDVGQLGLGEDVMETTSFLFVSALGDKIVDACAGGMHTVALDINGKVWTFGCNDEGALGRTTGADGEEGSPAMISLPGKAVAITAGDSHTAALLENGDVYAWGSFRDSHGSMGLVVEGREAKSCREPVRLQLREPATGIASGGDHLAILTISGSIFTMGCAEQGQLGRLPQRSANRDTRQGFSALLVPTQVTFRPGAKRIWAGSHATFALDANGEKVYAWGLNNYGQLGIRGEKRKCALYTPTECDAFTSCEAEGWSQMTCGQHHSLALDSAGICYALGRREYGRLGLGERNEDAENLEPIPKLADKKCISIAAGVSSSFAVTETGEIYSWGMGSEGQLGTGSEEDLNEPRLITGAALEGYSATRVSAGGQHTVLLLANPVQSAEAESTLAQIEEPEEVAESSKKKEPEKKGIKRQKAAEDAKISSTSMAQTADPEPTVRPAKKLKVDDITPMETDVIDKPQGETSIKEPEIEPEPIETNSEEPKMDTVSKEVTEQKPAEPEKEVTNEEKKDEKITEENETKTEKDSEEKPEVNDVEMKEEKLCQALNGNDEPEVQESVVTEKSKTITETSEDKLIPSGNALTTSA